MAQAVSRSEIQAFLAQTEPFSQLEANVLQQLARECEMLRYRIGQPILQREVMPTQVAIIYIGQVRLLGYDARTQSPASVKLAGPGEILGWSSLLRGVAFETAIASTEVICITIPAQVFLSYLEKQPILGEAFRQGYSVCEVFDLLSLELQRRAIGGINLKDLTLQVLPDTTVISLPSGTPIVPQLDSEKVWIVSSGMIGAFSTGSRFPVSESGKWMPVQGQKGARLIGVRLPIRADVGQAPVRAESEKQVSTPDVSPTPYRSSQPRIPLEDIPPAPDFPEAPPDPTAERQRFPFVKGRGPIEAPLACFKMLSQHLGVPFRRDVIRKVLENQIKATDGVTLMTCGAIAEMMGIGAQLVQVPAQAVPRLKGPALIQWQDSFAVVFKITEKELVIAIPEEGIRRRNPQEFAATWGQQGQVLLLQPRPDGPKEKFSLRWFLPAISKHRKVLIEVFIASFFVQLFALANPLITQVIIDKVLVQRSIDTLHVLGIFLLGVAIFEGLLTYLRTLLFADTTNRIDLSLGSEVIDHLLRLPLNYFDHRRVGELAGRVNELENIRSFLTGTALTVVLDAIFSVIYIVVMVFYSVPLTIVALFSVPLFVVLTLFMAPIVQRKLRTKAERLADAQSYLVEVLSGIQTVKAQTIELKSRWQWQEKYARYVTAGFQTVKTFSTASSISGFLNKLSGLLLLWAGAYLVLDNKMTLGQLIAFRIIAGYVTSPLLRLAQLWQNFQETGLSIERLSDILDAHPEADEVNRSNITMPPIEGSVKYDNVSFRFNPNGPLQLVNVNIEFPPGTFVGIVGQSGSGKSTMMKLLQRLYEPTAGRIQVDQYDIAKVELYSLRRQIGMVLQDTLLFNGTVRENISLTNPEASDEEIIAAAKIAVAHDFIMGLPNGYNTVIGERGSSLSGGQRQRLAIARTVLQNPRLLILDEATSALDYHSEHQVCANLAAYFDHVTVFFITHRLSTVRNADVILMMDQGAVVEQGSHKELMALRGRYYCLYQQQEAELS